MSADHPLELAQAQREHRAWLALCRELKNASASLDINEEDALHAAIILWGENLAHLRMTQDRETWDRAYDEAAAKYNRAVGFLPY